MQQEQNKLILYLVILLGFAGGYFYYSQAYADPSVDPLPQTADVSRLKNLRIDFSLLQKAEYRVLRAFGESPVNPGVHGKTDPFAQ